MMKINLNQLDYGRSQIYCEKFSCMMFVKACVARQIKKHTWGSTINPRENKKNHTFTYPECTNCKQGKEILKDYQKFKEKGGQQKGG